MKASILSSILNAKILIHATLLFCFISTTLIAHAEEEVSASSPESVIASASEKININTADAKQIASSLKGIGLKKAMAIIEYRKTYGPFQNIEELTSVSGIGDATVQKNAHLIAI